MRIVCQLMILMKYHTLVVIFENVENFLIVMSAASYWWDF